MIGRLFGRLMRGVHAGEHKLVWNQTEVRSPETIVVSSPAFTDGNQIPKEFAGIGVGNNQSPPLIWENLPNEAVELVLVVEDPDAPLPVTSIHLIATGIPPQLRSSSWGIQPRESAHSILYGQGCFGKAPIRRSYPTSRSWTPPLLLFDCLLLVAP
jgi:phosphatidylethanolamine-binding protein (PEBP) family uncharacterized protein